MERTAFFMILVATSRSSFDAHYSDRPRERRNSESYPAEPMSHPPPPSYPPLHHPSATYPPQQQPPQPDQPTTLAHIPLLVLKRRILLLSIRSTPSLQARESSRPSRSESERDLSKTSSIFPKYPKYS